ncbi:MAG: DUF3575 domain-containing protein [Bacteroidales bacterium]|nr:DUF3575 domain-containing protein [Candidatus Colimorpha onthohippi]
MKKLIVWGAIVALSFSSIYAQRVAIKTNVLGWLACGTANVGIDYHIGKHFAAGADFYANPFMFGDDRSAQHLNITLSGSYYFCEAFHGSYIGLHALHACYDAGLGTYNYDGHLNGVGLHYGFVLPLSRHWRLDLMAGVGYAQCCYDLEARQYHKGDHEMLRHHDANCWGITRLQAAIAYQF